MLPLLQSFMPQHGLSRFAGKLANNKLPWLKNRLIHYFVTRYPVNLAEAIESNPYAYTSFNDFFTRALKPDARPIASGLYDLVSPADGRISQLGNLQENQILQAKNHLYTVEALLGGKKELAVPFLNGSFMTIYLAPENYHRVHMPVDGALCNMLYIPGQLFSVNTKTTDHIPTLFARNERVVALFNTSLGKVAVILVGAMIVGSIETVWAGTVTSIRRQDIKTITYEHPIHLKRGQEMGRFKLGSTVIVLFEENTVSFDPHRLPTEPVKMGEKLGLFKPDRW